jgi:hypothetical protein
MQQKLGDSTTASEWQEHNCNRNVAERNCNRNVAGAQLQQKRGGSTTGREKWRQHNCNRKNKFDLVLHSNIEVTFS